MIYILRIFMTVILIALLWAAGFVCFTASNLLMKPQKPAQITDAIVVLTGGEGRIEEGLRLFAAGKAPHLFISGVHPSVTDADIAAMWKGPGILPPCCITLGHQATSTWQNARETQAWIHENRVSSIRLVTANYHMHRANMEMSFALPAIEIIAHPVEQNGLDTRKEWFWIVTLSEYHKTLFRLLSHIFATDRETP